MEHWNFEEIDGKQPLRTIEGNTLYSERYREGREINKLFFLQNYPWSLHPQEKMFLNGYKHLKFNLLPFREIVQRNLVIISLKFAGKSIMTTGDSLTARIEQKSCSSHVHNLWMFSPPPFSVIPRTGQMPPGRCPAHKLPLNVQGNNTMALESI